MITRRHQLISSITVVLLAPVLLATSGCSGEFANGIASIDACRAATTVSGVPAENPEQLANTLAALVTALPEEVQPAAQVLASQAGGVGDAATGATPGAASEAAADTAAEAVTQQGKRLQALVDVQTWVLETCGSYFTLGAAPASHQGATELKLGDYETVLGEDSEGHYLSVIGAADADAALELCRQALARNAPGGQPAVIQVLDQMGRALAASFDGECRVVAAPEG